MRTPGPRALRPLSTEASADTPSVAPLRAPQVRQRRRPQPRAEGRVALERSGGQLPDGGAARALSSTADPMRSLPLTPLLFPSPFLSSRPADQEVERAPAAAVQGPVGAEPLQHSARLPLGRRRCVASLPPPFLLASPHAGSLTAITSLRARVPRPCPHRPRQTAAPASKRSSSRTRTRRSGASSRGTRTGPRICDGWALHRSRARKRSGVDATTRPWRLAVARDGGCTRSSSAALCDRVHPSPRTCSSARALSPREPRRPRPARPRC